MWPGAPTQLSGKLIVMGETDPATGARVVRRAAGLSMDGVWLDDTTPDLAHREQLAIERYGPLDMTVFILIAPKPNEDSRTEPHGKPRRYLLEFYPDHAGVPRRVFFPLRRDYGDIIVQHKFPGLSTQWLPKDKWPEPPTPQRQRELVGFALDAVNYDRDRVWLF